MSVMRKVQTSSLAPQSTNHYTNNKAYHINDQSQYFFQNSVSLLLTQFTQTAKHIVLLHPCLPVINPYDINKNGQQK